MTTALVPIARPPSEQLVDLHVYLVPTEVWNEKYHSAYNDVISQTISAGFVRVWPELSLYYLRNQIIDQLGYDVLPSEYMFLKSVGRCLTQVKTKQEFELKVKNFIPPQVNLPELFVLEAKRDDLSLASFQESEHDSPRSNHDRMGIIGAQRPSNVGVQHAPDTSRTAQQTNNLQDISMGTPSPNQSPRSILKHHPNQPSHISHHHHQSTNMNHSPPNNLGNTMIDNARNTPQPSSRLPHLVSQGSQTNTTMNATHFNSKTPSQNPGKPSPHLPTQSQMGSGSPQKSHFSPHHQPLTPLPARLTQLSDPDSSPNSSNNSAGSSGRVATIILPPDLVTNQHSNPQHRHVSSVISNSSFIPFMDTSHSSPANVHFNPPESPGSGNWAVTQPIRVSYTEHQSHTCATPFQTPNVTPGGVPPLPLQHLEPVKGMDPASPLKSGRPDTYTNNTNEDSGIAELEYGRQDSDSMERKERDENRQGQATFLINSREGPEGGRVQPREQSRLDKNGQQHLGDGTPLPSSAAAQDAKRRRQAEAREKQQQEREKKIKDDAAREQEYKERQLEMEKQRQMEKHKKKKGDEEERQRLIKARQQEIDKRRQQQAEAKRLKEEEEEKEMEEEIRRRQADELKQSRQMSHQDAKRKERERFTPHSQRGGSRQQKDQYDEYAKDFIRKEGQFGGNTRQSNRTQDEGVSLADEMGGSAGNDGSLKSAGASPDGGQGTSEVSSRGRYDSEGERTLAKVHEMQDKRYLLESEREELMRFAKTLQSRMIDRRNKDEDEMSGTLSVRDLWKKRYFEEKKKTNPLEEQVNRLRGQLDQQHRKLLSHLEGKGAYNKGNPRLNAPPSKKNDHKILIFKTKHAIEDLKRRVENSKMKLTSEIKLRNQAETELRSMRSDVIQRKINVTISTSKSKLQNTKGRDEVQPSRNMATRGTGVSITPQGSQKRGVKF